MTTTNTPLPSTSVGSSTSASTSAFISSLTNNINIDAENTLCVSHNSLLQARRDAGEVGILIDEPLLSRLPDPPVMNAGQEWISAYLSLTPGTRIRAVKALDAIKPSQAPPNSSASTSKVIFITDQEVKASSVLDSAYDLGIHSSIFNLANACQYIPLTLFTNVNTKRLHREGLTLKKVKSSINGVTHHLLNLSQFESEDGMDSFTWQEAWLCYLVWLADAAQPVIHERWKWHYTMLSKDKAVHDNFKAILTFDINTHSRYAAQAFQHDERDWQHRLQAAKYDILYDASRKNVKRPHEGQDSSFWDITQPSDSHPKSDPLCLICQRTGHHFSDCKEETMAKGKQTFAKYTRSHLARRSNNSTLCISFNLSNPRRVCKSTHAPSQHLCSFCGESAHGALSRRCL
ncbi:hypothetical protein PAXRUDRAFT_802788 [Paxillus rubicundulus Ve08.2h10]|uniref:Uncharacterized protein n=1 Tax=Paxillus rubicundulus Ve08.2h10 TaxID=930991 RepID=A0A0D0DAZ5_9AGAM|nr:hypothetical protein PAXRUDRAFT_802788 [Paxillus rubicundulus Ve08.2h10]